MGKFIPTVLAFCFIALTTACVYDPKAYEEQRKEDNAAHDKQGY